MSELWCHEDGQPIFNKAMSRNCFIELMACERFDQHDQRNPIDKFSPFHDIFRQIVDKFSMAFKADPEVKVDEQLVNFRGCCPFKMYISSKPGKYGIKLWALADVNTHYCINLLPYEVCSKSIRLFSLTQRSTKSVVQSVGAHTYIHAQL